jgi:NAD(P)-dependent dehydrogenase (short-subunit alcohol dehydrogenase family)
MDQDAKSIFDHKIDGLIEDIKEVLQLIDTSQITLPNDKIRYLDPLTTRLKHKMKQTSMLSPQNATITAISKQRNPYCYVCKVKLWKDCMRHETYNDMCWLCGNININKRNLKKDLSGKVAVVTGGRVKIGFETAVRLLRNGCTVVVTSRFIDDCLERYKSDPGFNVFSDRLFIYQLNMLDGGNVKKFVQYIFDNFAHVDYLINNAAQTIKRPIEFFNHLLKKIPQDSLPDSSPDPILVHPILVYRNNDELLLLESNKNMLIEYDQKEIEEIFPLNEFDIYGQQLDLRTNNSWMLEADSVNISELAEVYIINSIGPYMLSTMLKPVMSKSDNNYSWIINVTSMEGVFNWNHKSSRHPHTNMAKAALNMFTRTCGQYFAKLNIVMVCVDTGWNNPQQPNSYDFQTPVDCADGAARILDPIYRELKQTGVFYKDFEQHAW